mmetsp:Transcript_61549/g.133214  ORF Transcript_61549/g.133214 Transcript_61549/m.133214 type:complete len:220 (-) Transcript_61549:310-969(-)
MALVINTLHESSRFADNGGLNDDAAMAVTMALSSADDSLPGMEWVVSYVNELGHLPNNHSELFNFITNRGGHLSYKHAKEALASARGPGVADVRREALSRPQWPVPTLAYALPVSQPRRLPPTQLTRRKRAEGASSTAWYKVVHDLAEQDCCPICLDADGDDFVEVRCGHRHRFHRECVEAWVSSSCSQRCPTCRQNFLPSHVFVSVPSQSATDASFRS